MTNNNNNNNNNYDATNPSSSLSSYSYYQHQHQHQADHDQGSSHNNGHTSHRIRINNNNRRNININNANGNNNNANKNGNRWKWLSIFLLVLLLSLQLGVVDIIKTSIGSGTSPEDRTHDLSRSSSSGNTRMRGQQHHRHHDHRSLQVDDEISSSASSSFSSDTIFESLEARHEHHFASRNAPFEHHHMAESRSNSNRNRRDMAATASQPPPPPGQASRRGQEMEDETTTATNNENNNDNAQNAQAAQNSQSILNTSMEGRLRATLLTNYDRNSYPWEWAWEQHYNATGYDREGNTKRETANGTTAMAETTEETAQQKRTGLPVELGLNIHKVHDLNVAESTIDLVVWVRMKWTDPRLMWDPSDFDGLTQTWFFISEGIGGGESSEIWTPDMYLWNQEEAMPKNLADTYATVSSDGSVFWSRPGRIKSTCKFEGIENFPFDKLGCKLEFGSWTHSGLFFRPKLLDGTGYTIRGSDTAAGSYVEFNLMDEEVTIEELIYPPYPCCPEEDWPVLIYTFKFSRASAHYV